jgi:hypothetical protein
VLLLLDLARAAVADPVLFTALAVTARTNTEPFRVFQLTKHDFELRATAQQLDDCRLAAHKHAFTKERLRLTISTAADKVGLFYLRPSAVIGSVRHRAAVSFGADIT